MTEMYGVDHGIRQTCRVCQYDRFYVENGTGTVNAEPVSIMTVKCSRCGTPIGHYQIDWKSSNLPEDVVTIEDGVKRDPW